MSKSFRNVDDSFGAHSAAAQRQKNDARSEAARLLSARFEILETIVESETHPLYLARDLSLSSADGQTGSDLVRLKLLAGAAASDGRQIDLFHLEARAAAKLAHKNIIKATEAEEIDGIHFYVIQHKPDAESLRALLKREGWFELDRALEIIKQVADALSYAHQLGVLHLTLQPEKILVEPDGTVLVTGFGIESRKDLLWAHQERSHSCAPQYISPEQVQCKQIDQRSDLYSLGILMFEMLTDRVPFDSQDAISIKLKHLNRLPEPPHMFRPELPRLLCWLVMDLLKKKPDERPASVGVFESALQQCMASGLKAGEAVGETAEGYAPLPADVEALGEQEQVEALPGQEQQVYFERETERDSSHAPEADASADDVAPESLAVPLIISEADAPGDYAVAYNDIEAQNFSGVAYPEPAPAEDVVTEPPPRMENYGAKPGAVFAFEPRMMTEAAEPTGRHRYYGVAWLVAILLLAAACLVWAMRGSRSRQSAGAKEPVLAADTSSAVKPAQESKSEAHKAEPSRPEALRPDTLKLEALKPLEPSAGSEAAISAQSNKSPAKNERDARDKQNVEAGPVAKRELPQEFNSARLRPPAVPVIPSTPGLESGTPTSMPGRDALSDARPEEPPPAIQPAKREGSPAPKTVRRSGDVLQNSAISRVKPTYPEAAKSAHVSGPVTVEVTVDEEGNVIAARAISGPDQLKEAAINAARGWKWMPTRIDRTRVKVVGTITLNFQR